MGAFLFLFSPSWENSRGTWVYVRECVRATGHGAFVCGVKGKAPSFSIGKSPLLVVLSLLLLPEATGWSQLTWWAPITPPQPPARSP